MQGAIVTTTFTSVAITLPETAPDWNDHVKRNSSAKQMKNKDLWPDCNDDLGNQVPLAGAAEPKDENGYHPMPVTFRNRANSSGPGGYPQTA